MTVSMARQHYARQISEGFKDPLKTDLYILIEQSVHYITLNKVIMYFQYTIPLGSC